MVIVIRSRGLPFGRGMVRTEGDLLWDSVQSDIYGGGVIIGVNISEQKAGQSGRKSLKSGS